MMETKLIDRPDISLSRRTVLSGLAVAMAVGLGLNPTHLRAAEQDVKAILNDAAKAMANLTSFHFELATEGGTTTVMEGLQLSTLSGDVVRPDSFQATATVKIAIVSLDLTIIGIGENVWITDPRSAEGQFVHISGPDSGDRSLSLTDVLNPDRILLQAVDLIQDPSIDGSEKIDGTTMTKIKGIFDLNTTALATPMASVLDFEPMPVELWIDDQNYVRQLSLDGPLTTAEPRSIKRILKLTNFDEQITIEPPASS